MLDLCFILDNALNYFWSLFIDITINKEKVKRDIVVYDGMIIFQSTHNL